MLCHAPPLLRRRSATRVSANCHPGSENLIMSQASRETLAERYRPQLLEDLAGNANVKRALVAFAQAKEIPHFLFFGPPGTGKTTAAKAMCRAVIERPAGNVMELNASDERGIDVVREKIKAFASTQGMAPSLKVVILDEADSMTKDAQNALRRIIELHAKRVRFVIICNYPTKLIPAIKSRCAPFRFAPIKPAEIADYLHKIVAAEGLSATAEGLARVAELASGDLRKAINLLDGVSGPGSITAERVNRYYPSDDNSEVAKFYQSLWTSDFVSLSRSLQHLKQRTCLGTKEILNRVADCLVADERPQVGSLLQELSAIEHRLSIGCSEVVQENAIIALFVLQPR